MEKMNAIVRVFIMELKHDVQREYKLSVPKSQSSLRLQEPTRAYLWSMLHLQLACAICSTVRLAAYDVTPAVYLWYRDSRTSRFSLLVGGNF